MIISSERSANYFFDMVQLLSLPTHLILLQLLDHGTKVKKEAVGHILLVQLVVRHDIKFDVR